ncbi:hypothetical protein M9H77_21970 [Catharanthus roseus]|uniref:Uncharacterized protein n=1 Tax=Catharanthus roseus TaxID=4058 RepID=A0ACC0AQC1_CATRO|nr:hypothetical protein M9H77_21970 [Catharanthus roseus]
MKPGDKLFDKIDNAIMRCKIGVAVFSPRYCDSYFCLHELALMVESHRKVIPIFCDVKPSELCVPNNGNVPNEDIQRFKTALEEAKYTVGLAFDSNQGVTVPHLYLKSTKMFCRKFPPSELGGCGDKCSRNCDGELGRGGGYGADDHAKENP